MTDTVAADAAQDATRRALLLAAAVSLLFSATVALLVVPMVNTAIAPRWWTTLVVTAFAALLAGGAVAGTLGARSALRFAFAGTVLLLGATLVYPFAAVLGAQEGQNGTVPWLLTAIAAPSLVALVTAGWRWAAVLIGAWVIVVVFSRSFPNGYALTGLANDTQALLAAVTTCVVADFALRTAAHVDRSAAHEAAAAVREAGERARLSARSRAAAFVHDEVLAALRGVADSITGTEDAVLRQAARATDTVRAQPPSDDPFTSVEELSRQAGAVLVIHRAPDAATCPPEVADALVAAASQALQNVRQHAPGAACRVRIDVDADGGLIEIADDGPGFRPEDVDTRRLGLAATVLGVPSEIPGVRAEVHSAPGEGTRVRLAWRVGGAAPEAAGTDGWGLRTRERIIGTLFLVTQTAVAAGAAAQSGDRGGGAVSLAMLMILVVLTSVLARARTAVSRTTAGVVVALLCGSVAFGLIGIPVPITYGSAWFVTAAAFVLVFLTLRDRGGHAAAGAGILLVLITLDAIARRADVAQVLGIGTRVATVVGLSVVFVEVLRRLRRSADAQAERRVASARRTAWDIAAHAELVAHLTEVERSARPLLERVVRAGAISEADRAEARAAEGRLRDAYRAGRLHGHGIADAAKEARLRGVDVVLLDDGGAADPAGAWMPGLADLVRERLSTAEHRVVVRVLPPGRAVLAHVVADGRLTSYPAGASAGSAGSTSIGVHGE